MNIADAATRWGVKSEKVVEYLFTKGIEGLTCKGTFFRLSDVEIPDIPKPDDKISESRKDEDSCLRKILKAYANNRYVNATILSSTDEGFEYYLSKLVEGGYLEELDKPDEPCMMLRYRLTESGKKNASSRTLNFNINFTQNNSLIHIS